LVTDEIVDHCHQQGIALVICDEERVEVLKGLDHLPILGICSDCPEILKPWPSGLAELPKMVCHRGANFLAPENTLTAASICIAQGFDIVEADVRTTANDEIVLMHDTTVDRTSNGKGPIRELTLEQVHQLDAGSSYSQMYVGTGCLLLMNSGALSRSMWGLCGDQRC
jgi:glycerophosphoryl diester phosphodiesterase